MARMLAYPWWVLLPYPEIPADKDPDGHNSDHEQARILRN